MTADGLLVCIKDSNLRNKYLNSAVFMVFLVDYKLFEINQLIEVIFCD